MQENLDLYQILSLPLYSPIEAVKKAYKKLVKVYHPDINKSNEAEVKMIEINHAYSVLSDEKSKNKYDISIIELSDKYPLSKNKDIHITYLITLEESFFGKHVSIKYKTKNTNSCQSITFNIPAHIQDGKKLIFFGYGEKSLQGNPGNLVVTVRLKKHETFEIHHSGILTTEILVDAFDLITGRDYPMKLIDRIHVLSISKATQPDTIIRIPKAGLYDESGNRGDIFVTLKAKIPNLTENQIESIKKLK